MEAETPARARPAGRWAACLVLFTLISAASTASATPLASAGSANPTSSSELVRRIAVFGADNRATLPARFDHLRLSIGLVYSNEAHSVCSGFCVADSVVATAAHCLYRTSGQRRPPLRTFRFALHASAKRGGSRISGHGTRSPDQFVMAGDTNLSIEPPIDATSDWALMRLERPICRGANLDVLPATANEVAAYARKKNLIHVSFHRNFQNWGLAYSGPCDAQSEKQTKRRATIERDFNAPERLVLHTCDTAGASSGSPLLALLPDGGVAVVGLNVGTYVQTRLLLEKGKVVHRYKADPIANTAVAAAAFQPGIALFAGAPIIASARNLKRLQRELRQRELYTGRVDGAFGPLLRGAIERYERRAGLPTSGLATENLLRTLIAETSESTPRRTAFTSQNTSRAQLGGAITRPAHLGKRTERHRSRARRPSRRHR